MSSSSLFPWQIAVTCSQVTECKYFSTMLFIFFPMYLSFHGNGKFTCAFKPNKELGGAGRNKINGVSLKCFSVEETIVITIFGKSV
jgi:hypothetical protein